jgi:hypothetical protein
MAPVARPANEPPEDGPEDATGEEESTASKLLAAKRKRG